MKTLRKTEKELEETKEDLTRRKEIYNKLLVEHLGLKTDYSDKCKLLEGAREEIAKLG